MRLLAFASRNGKEILRDKLTLFFGIGFPVVLLLLLSAIQANVPVTLFAVENLTPGIAVFGLSFLALFSGLLIAKDRTTALMQRLFTSPLRPSEFIFGYILPLLPMAVAQSILCFLVALPLGLSLSPRILLVLAVLLPADVLFIALGLLCGSVFNDKQVGGICGALLTNLSAWLSGTWFDVSLVGGVFETIADLLPFCHAVEAGRAALCGNFSGIFPHLWWVIGYAAALSLIAIWAFTKKLKSDA